MAKPNLPKNLRLLCSYAPSISRVCRDLKMNRQQFHRYLSGANEPSLRKLRVICDYFGVEESEILLNFNDFRDIVAIKNLRPSLPDPFGNFVAKMHQINPTSTSDLADTLGYYYTYVMTQELGGKILRALARLYTLNDYVYVKTVENYSNVKHRKRDILKYSGVVYHTGQEIVIHEREVFAGRMMWTTILNPTDNDQFSILAGLSLGVTSANRRDIAAYRVIWERLDSEVSMRDMLQGCGVFESGSKQISEDICKAIENEISPDENVFISRPWEIDRS